MKELDELLAAAVEVSEASAMSADEIMAMARLIRAIPAARDRLSALPQQAGGEDAKDAARYRWLREKGLEIVFYGEGQTLWFCPLDDAEDRPHLDAAIDAAIGGTDDA